MKIDGLVEQGEVRQDPVTLQRGDPVLGREFVPAPPDCPQCRTAGPVLGFHVVVGGCGFGPPGQFSLPYRQGVLLPGEFVGFRVPGGAGGQQFPGEAVGTGAVGPGP